jgi:hypothetical protein
MVRWGLIAIAASMVGCASTWDTVSNRQWQKDLWSRPGAALFGEEPMAVLRTNPDGHARAKAMLKLQPPDRQTEEYAEAMGYLAEAAGGDPSPVVRAAAIQALGRFRDNEKTVQVLQNAYGQANGPGASTPAEPGMPGMLFGPTGYPPEIVSMLKVKVIDAMAEVDHPDSRQFVSRIATTVPDGKSSPVDRDVRLAAISAMAKDKSPQSAKLLHHVMTLEQNRDTAMANRAHEGLMALSGQRLPMTSPEWGRVVHDAMEIAPEPNAIQRAAAWVTVP